MIIKKSNQIIDLRGETYKGSILIRGAVSNVTIENGTVEGEIRCRAESYRDVVERWNKTGEWTRAIREASPSYVTLRDLKVLGGEDVHQVYLGPGTTYVDIRKVRFVGRSAGPSLYMSMESGHHRVTNCVFNSRTGSKREVIAIDGSADNVIRNNLFRNCKWGGIYIYRNSGEHGTIRHQEPRRNLITRNRFDLRDMALVRLGLDLDIPWGVKIGSRQGSRIRHNDLDAGHPWGSSASDLDFARENVVIRNQFKGDRWRRWVLDNDIDNEVANNEAW
jgi:parallel beta-helix repeat protein